MKSRNAKKMGHSFTGEKINKRTLLHVSIFILIFLTLSGLYLHYAWNRYADAASSEAVMLAQSLESLLHPEHIAKLTGSAEDLEKTEYTMAKDSLTRLVNAMDSIYFAYILAEKDGDMVFLMDSEPPDSADYSPPGQVYMEATDTDWEPFQTGETVLTDPTTDRWGTWISALVPVKDPSSGNVIAVLGIDYSASAWQSGLWQQMIPDIIIVLTIFILCFSLLFVWNQHSALKKLSKKLEYNEALYHNVFNQAPVGIAIIDDKDFVTRSKYGDMDINSVFKQIIGRTSEDLLHTPWPEMIDPADLKTDLEKFEQVKAGKFTDYSMENRIVRPDGSRLWTNMKVSRLFGLPDKQSLYLCILEDISTRKAAEAALRESERSKSVLLSHLPGMAYRCRYDCHWTMQYVSDGCYALTGYTPNYLTDNGDLFYNKIITPEYRELIWTESVRRLSRRQPFQYEYEIITAGDERKWVLELGEGIVNEKDEIEAIEGIIIDISDRKELENTLVYINEHDRYTGLLNLYRLEKLLISEGKSTVSENRALIGINLGTTHAITAVYGYHYTQDLIKKTADTLRLHCTSKHLLFFTSWDRFVFYLKDYRDRNELYAFSTTIAKALELLLKTERIDGGIGIVEIDRDSEYDADLLLKKVLIASEKAMSITEKKFAAVLYDKKMEAQVMREEDIKMELAQIADDENDGGLFLQFQPILNINTNQICGFEALARINSAALGLIPPLEFIYLAEETKLIIPIGLKIIRRAFRFLNHLQEAGYEAITVSINVSAIQLFSTNFIDDLFGLIAEMQVRPENIMVELTESIFIANYEEINNLIFRLRESGIRVAIDDFGTGYSSLARERELIVDCLKIDKYFIDKVLKIDEEKAITRDIISIAHKLGHFAIAEGVEDEMQMNLLKKWGCDRIQGYLISKPLDEEKAMNLLKKERMT